MDMWEKIKYHNDKVHGRYIYREKNEAGERVFDFVSEYKLVGICMSSYYYFHYNLF